VSLIRATIRQCAVAALREDTWAEDRVFDSDNSPLVDALAVGDQAKPYIVVYTDTDNLTDVTDGLYSATRNLQLTLEMGVASAIQTEKDGVQISFPHSDPAMELMLDILDTQALAAVYGDPRSEWGELIRLMVTHVVRVNSPRGGRAEKGIRYAARQVVLVLDTISDPAPGVVLAESHPIKRFIALAEEKHPHGIHDAASIINTVLTSNAYPSWQRDQAWLGLTKRGVRAIGIAPLADLAPGATPWATEEGEDITAPSGEGPMATQIGAEDEDEGETVQVVPATPNDPNV
jgi:hypothetical protein